MISTKVCGLTTPEAVDAALAGRAAFIGFMAFPASSRDIDPAAAARLALTARGKAKIVAITVDPLDDQLDRLMNFLAPDFIQLHGRETPARAREIAQRTGAGVIKAVAVADARDLEGARRYEGAVDHLLFDAKAPSDSAIPGGLGVAFDWSLLAGARLERPWFLAGGLDPWNVAAAVAACGAPMVDVSSGVERGPGLKDPALIAAFLDAVRRL